MQQAVDVHRVLKFGTLRRDLIFLAIFVVCGPFALWKENWIVSGICIVGALFMLTRVILPHPAMVLMPEGIHYDYDGIKFFIPWIVVQAVDTCQLASREKRADGGVTVLTIPRAFYDEHVHVRHGKLLNPSRGEYFIRHSNIVEVVIYHAIVHVSQATMLAEIEARWRAFGRRDPRTD